MSKTPYEIRLELLQMAQEHLQKQYELNVSFAMEAMRKANDAQWKSLAEVQKLMPKSFDMEDIIKKATELYCFVQKKD